MKIFLLNLIAWRLLVRHCSSALDNALFPAHFWASLNNNPLLQVEADLLSLAKLSIGIQLKNPPNLKITSSDEVLKILKKVSWKTDRHDLTEVL